MVTLYYAKARQFQTFRRRKRDKRIRYPEKLSPVDDRVEYFIYLDG